MMLRALARARERDDVADVASAGPDEALLEFLYLTPVALLRFRPDGRIDLANPEAARLLIPLADDADMTNTYPLLSKLVPDLRQHVSAFRPPFGQIFQNLRVTLPDAATVLMLTVNKIDPGTFMAVVQDITQIVTLRACHSHDQSNLQAIYEHVGDYAVCKLGLDGRIVEWNASLERLGGWAWEDLAETSLVILLPPDHVPTAVIDDFLERARGYGTASLECWNARRDGSRFRATVVATVMPDSDGCAAGFVLVIHDLTLQRQMQEAQRLAATDPLTEALNRRAGVATVAAAFGQWQTQGRVFSIVMVDLDHFKAINDSRGHECGDQVLVSAVQLIRAHLRDGDSTIRWGGEEFMVLLPATGLADAYGIAERIRTAIEAAHIVVDNVAVPITISAGVAQAWSGCGDASEIVRAADEALYAAKRGGRNRVITAGQGRLLF
jgi:diguanylate cyclase (GGDEF)-like protein/PAS domain S-box-containing protein